MVFFKKKSDTKKWLLEQLGSSQDVVMKEIKAEDKKGEILYIRSLCDESKLQNFLYKPFYETNKKQFEHYLDSLPNNEDELTKEKLLKDIMQGSIILFINDYIYTVEAKKVINNTIGEATIETVIQGPQNGLSEVVETNINLIRHRYPQASLQLEQTNIGKLSQTKVAIMYDKDVADEKLIKEVKKQLSKVEVDVLQSVSQLHKQMTNRKRSLFPTMMITERPDRIVHNLAQGKIVIIIEGSPFSLIAPAVFYDFMSSMEEVYQLYWISRFIIVLRYIGLFISIILPALYIGIIAFNPEIFRVQLALSIAGSRLGVPYPAFLEVLFMLLMMELLTEASVRLPKQIGSTATTVGGLILGQAAVEASLISSVMIIIVGAVAIANFVIPINSMSFAMRVVKYVLLGLTVFFGMIGLVFGVIGLVIYIANLESFGQPYLKLFFQSRSKGAKKEASSS
ncbi:spore germination protein [Metabacillus fastidiosus]|uniref:spore germination protein n=1 Tax=Metabacillus fastidiosus TaxID=1458 RepID=UPI003D26BE98